MILFFLGVSHFIKNQSWVKNKMPPTRTGGRCTINFDKLHFFFAITEICSTFALSTKKDGSEEASSWQLFDNIDHRAEMWGSAVLVRGQNACSEMLVAYEAIVGSQVIRTTRIKSDNLSVCHDVMRRERSSSSSLMTRAEAEASDGNDIGSVNKVRANYARGSSTPPALANY